MEKERQWLTKCKNVPSSDQDFQRLRVLESGWRMSDSNESYELCDTYPHSLYVPDSLKEEDFCIGATQRSMSRAPALVWMHNNSKAPLCRAAQPLAGKSEF